MDLEQQKKHNEIALNVSRTRITVLVFNLTIIALMLSLISAHSMPADQLVITHLTSSVALFIGFCLTILGLLWLLYSQNLDTIGMSRPWPFTLGSMTTYLALSQTVTAFMHEYLVGVKSAIDTSIVLDGEKTHAFVRLGLLDDSALLVLFCFGGIIWLLTTYLSPLGVVLKSPVCGNYRWFFVAYYFLLQIPIYWVYATTWQLEYVPVDQDMNLLSLFALQFIQPVLWFH